MSNPYEIRKSAFYAALSRLEQSLAQEENEFIRDACIQRFEFTYELAWKTLKLYLASKDIDVRNAKDSLKASYQQGLIDDADAWSELHLQRNLTSHTYDEDLAERVYHFLKDRGLNLFQALKIKLDSL